MASKRHGTNNPNISNRTQSKRRLNWFKFGRRDKKNPNEKQKRRNRAETDVGLAFASRQGQSDANASQMLTNAALFPMQYNEHTYSLESFPDELLFIPFKNHNPDSHQSNHSPSSLISTDSSNSTHCLKLNHQYGVSALLIHGNPKNNPTHFMVIFHANGVDLGLASITWRPLIRSLPIHLLLVEYPGYGIMDGRCTCKEVLSVADNVYQYITTSRHNGGLGVSPSRLIILGRSIGTGPASYIATNKCHSLILISPFTSIHDLSSKLMGKWTTWILPKDHGHVTRQRSESLHDLSIHLNHQQEEEEQEQEQEQESLPSYNMNGQRLSVSIESIQIDSPCTETHSLQLMESKTTDDDHTGNPKKEMMIRSQSVQPSPTGNGLNSLKSPTNIQRSQSSPKSQQSKRSKGSKDKQFVFNNVAQIAQWQCQNVMIFHGKSDDLIPYQHTETIIDVVNQTSYDSLY